MTAKCHAACSWNSLQAGAQRAADHSNAVSWPALVDTLAHPWRPVAEPTSTTNHRSKESRLLSIPPPQSYRRAFLRPFIASSRPLLFVLGSDRFDPFRFHPVQFGTRRSSWHLCFPHTTLQQIVLGQCPPPIGQHHEHVFPPRHRSCCR